MFLASCAAGRLPPRNGPISAWFFAQIAAHTTLQKPADVGPNVMNKDFGTFGLVIGGIVALAAAIFIFTGGQLGGKKTVDSDEDLPPIATTDR